MNRKIQVFIGGIAIGLLASKIFKSNATAPGVGKLKKISKDSIKAAMYEPKGDYYFEKLNAYTYKLHLTPQDASMQKSLFGKFNAIPAGNGYYGSAYIITNK